MEMEFLSSIIAIGYANMSYPLAVAAWARTRPLPVDLLLLTPSAGSVARPIHNEENKIRAKVKNLLAEVPEGLTLEPLVVTDGCSDGSVGVVWALAAVDPRIRLLERATRGGKGAALNAGVEAASHDLMVFTDAALHLDPDALAALLKPFSDPRIGCVSGEDRIVGENGGDPAYGRYELWLRTKESETYSIVGASGCLHAQRRSVVPRFEAGIAPDFLSVLHSVGQGFRVISEWEASVTMRATPSAATEFSRKACTFVRGMAGLFACRGLMNPIRYGRFAFILASHKLVRWLAPVFLLSPLVSNALLVGEVRVYLWVFAGQMVLYALGLLALPAWSPLRRVFLPEVCGYFLLVNAAIACSGLRYLRGDRMEIWQPTLRETA